MGELIRIFDHQPRRTPGRQAKHTLEVTIEDLRAWYADQQIIMDINNQLREVLLEIRQKTSLVK
jgi:hypothetical protein